MNVAINKDLMQLTQLLNKNGYRIESIEAVHDCYGKQHIFRHEVAEITYRNGYRVYANIDGDDNITAIFDIIAVLKDFNERYHVVGEIMRNIYETGGKV